MAAPLEFKRRVRMPDATEPPLPKPRRSPALGVGVLTWLAAVGLAWGVSAGSLPVGHWLDASRSAAPDRAPAARSFRSEPRFARSFAPAPATAPLAPLEPVAAAEPSAPVAVGPTPAVEPPPAVEPAPSPNLRAPEPTAPVPAPSLAAVEPPAQRLAPPPAEPTAEPGAPEAPREPAPAGGTRAGRSCEAAAAAYNDEIAIGGARGPADLGAGDYARVLDAGGWFGHCGLPASSRLDVCVAVQNGRAKGVTARTTPRNAKVERCVARAAAGLAFPSHPRLDVARTHFE